MITPGMRAAGSKPAWRVASATITGLLVLLAGVIALYRYQAFAAANLVGIDYDFSVDLGRRWLETGTMYLPYQFAPYLMHVDELPVGREVGTIPSLYPPIAGPAYAVATALPAILWWAIPLAVVAWSLRGAPQWTWPLLAAAACWPNTSSSIIAGNTTMWIAAGVALGPRLGWPALVVALKPSFAPLLLVGARHRSFVVGAVLLLIASVAMIPEWIRYFEVVQNGQGQGILYSLADLPFVLMPIIAWVGRERMADDWLRRVAHTKSLRPGPPPSDAARRVS
jgi:hypothetical protein